jgi:hypothetical protein
MALIGRPYQGMALYLGMRIRATWACRMLPAKLCVVSNFERFRCCSWVTCGRQVSASK